MLDIYQCPAYVEEKISKAGNHYFQLNVKLTPGYTYSKFLEEEQIQIVKMYLMLKNYESSKDDDFVETE